MFLAGVLTVVLIIGAYFLWNRHLVQVTAENAAHLQETQAKLRRLTPQLLNADGKLDLDQ